MITVQKKTLTGIALSIALGFSLTANAVNPVDESLPMVGTDAHGHTYPGATVPFGAVQLSPDTRSEGWDGCSGYHYSDATIQGFSHTHLSGTGAGGLGDILLMPMVGEVHWNVGKPGDGYASKFSHAQEEARPGYYRVFLETPGVTAELTASERCGFHKYTFPSSEQSHIILDLAHGIGSKPVDESLHVENHDTVSGYRISDGWGGRRAIYFVMQFSKPFDSADIEQNDQRLADASEGQGRSVKAVFNYKTSAKEVVMVKVGISGTGIEGARKNLAAEISGWSFDRVHAAAVKQWKKVFDAAQIQTFDPHIAKTFYANLYLTCLAPVLFNDVDENYRGYDHQNHSGGNFQNYTTFSIWDIYRAEWPLLTLMQPGRVNDMVQTMLTEYPQLGKHTVPIWPLWGNETYCMIGYHSADMIAEAYLEGFRGFDAETAYQQMRDTAMQDRSGLDTYKRLGYVASVPGRAATSRTIEYTFDDWCIAKLAEALGHQEDAKLFYQRAANYRNLFDRTTEFFRGRKDNGQWRTPFTDKALVGDEYTEADAWQYAFAVQQDVPGLIALYGGDQGFIHKMDALFTEDSTIYTGIPDISGLIGQDSQGDEQCHHVPYLYDYANAPFEAQQRLRQIMSTLYSDTPAGQCGNTDCGQMAAWYVFSALGVYPVNPASGVFAIGSPAVSKAVVHLDRNKYSGRTFTVTAKNNSAENIYIQSATLNGKPLTRPWITRDEITSGGALSFVMGSKPNHEWGSASADRPPSTMPVDFQYAALPEPASTNQTVQFSLPIRIVCGGGQPVGDFLVDPDINEGAMNSADSPIDTSAANAAPAGVYQSERYGKDFTYTFPVPAGQHYLVRLHFAEIFGDGAGTRVENIYINRRPVLTNFDVFVAAGGMNKALVKEFPDIRPNRSGSISIRIAAAPGSPDQNAKISGIEILKQTATASTNASATFTVTAADGKTTIDIDTSIAPEFLDWAKNKLAPVLVEWYPKIVAFLPSPGYTAPTHYTITVKDMDGVAYTSGTDVSVSKSWIQGQMKGEAVGSLVHESVHVAQQYHNRAAPGWLVEGMADYVRWYKYEPQSHGADIVWMRHMGKSFSPRYDGSYRVTANFLNWVSEKYDPNIAVEANAAMRDRKYSADFWKQHTGKTVEELGAEWKQEIEAQLHPPAAATN
jgi:predicted alpha-1,2-mannosidase